MLLPIAVAAIAMSHARMPIYALSCRRYMRRHFFFFRLLFFYAAAAFMMPRACLLMPAH